MTKFKAAMLLEPHCIYILYRGAAKNTFYLKKVGVTHVLNTAEGQRQATVDTNAVLKIKI